MISIVMSYYNRLHLLKHTLKTLSQSFYKDFEIVIVDDFSNEENSIVNLPKEFPNLTFQIIEMKNVVSEKYYCNPCVPYNVGLRASNGDKIIIQNPECCHMGDVISYVDKFLNDEKYFAFHCFGCDRNDLKLLHNGFDINLDRQGPSKARWYNHKIHRPVAYHFTSAITRKNLIELNGFDERFASGLNYDDDELVQRIKRKGLNIEFIEDPYVIHQYHGKSGKNPLSPEPTQDNAILYAKILEEKTIKAQNKETIK